MSFEQVSFEYADGRPVLEGIDLELEPGKAVALIGHTGSGKTTLASLVPRFYDVSGGRVLVDGLDVRDAKVASLRREIGVVLQDPFLFSATVRENIAFARPDATDEEVERAARLAQADEFIAELPDGYDTVIGERGITLSGGQRQRIAIARALILDPRVLILDDATASVDATTEARIRTGLREAMADRTTIIIAHRLSTLALADELVVLDHGRIVARGTHEQLLGTSPVYREIYEHGLLEREFAERVEAAPDESRPHGRLRPPSGVARGEVALRPRRACARRHARLAARRASDDAARRRRARLVVARDAAQDPLPRALHEALSAPDDPRDRLAPPRDCDVPDPAVPDALRDRRRSPQGRPPPPDDHRHPDDRSGARQPRDRCTADVLHRLDRRADPRRPSQRPLPTSAAPLARLLRAQPRRRRDQPADERRRRARPARHRRRDDARAEHAGADRDDDHPLLPRLEARARDGDRDPCAHRRHRASSACARRARTRRCASASGS